VVEKQSNLADVFSENSWIIKLAYLADIFSRLMSFNLKLRGKNNNMFQHAIHIQGYQKKRGGEETLHLWQSRFNSNRGQATKSSQTCIATKDKLLEIKSAMQLQHLPSKIQP
jgi:hypothetical protein